MKRLVGLGTGLMSLVIVATAPAAPLNVQIDEVLAGANGDSSIQFIEIKMQSPTDDLWGPQGIETVGRVRLVYSDATGAVTGEYVFASDPPAGVLDGVNGGYSILLATQAFADLPGMPTPDFIIPTALLAVDGKVCLTANPPNPNAPDLNLCLSYGNFIADTEQDTMAQPAGAPTAIAPITSAASLQRTTNFANYGVGHYNADFSQATPAPRNSAGDTGTISVDPIADQGRNLFFHETFYGNGRTCHSCHQHDNSFGLSPTKISFLKQSDALFIAEQKPALATLENSCIMRGSRSLILENIDGFANPPVFRGSPHLTNIAETAPYGLSEEFADLQIFAEGAVHQHFPKTLARNDDPTAGPLDFRTPTSDELAAMEAFMQTIRLPANGDYTIATMTNAAIARGADAAAIQRGSDLFFGVTGTAQCFKCHSGPVLSRAHPSIGGGVQKFNTGVENLPINTAFPDACLNFTPLPAEAGGLREFGTPSLIGVARTAPYFHNNAVQTLRQTVQFYSQVQFNNSPAVLNNPNIDPIALTTQEVDDLVVFLTALDEPFVDCDVDTIDDRTQIAQGQPDCNNNGTLDSCELDGNDCNGNGTPDECDLSPVELDDPDVYTPPTSNFYVRTADVDGDNDEDLLVPGWFAGDITVLLNDGDGSSYTPSGPYTAGAFPRSIGVADLDHDGDLDLALPSLISNNVSVMMNNGVLATVWQGFAAGTPVTMTTPMGFSGVTSFALLADLDNDGWADLIACKQNAIQIAVCRNLGVDQFNAWQGFAAPVDYASGGSAPWTASTGRMNNDGFLDIVVANRGANNIGVFINNGAGGFLPVVTYPVANAPEPILAADLNNDTLADVIVGNSASDTISLYFNNGDGTLGTQGVIIVGSYPFGAEPKSIQAADLDNDGDRDLLICNKESKNISLMLNQDGAFPTLDNIPTTNAPDWVTIADLDNDGDNDFAVTSFVGPRLEVYLNMTPAFGADCNFNDIPDSCDIASGLVSDVNANTVPDVCEGIGDLNDDEVIDQSDLDFFVAVLLDLDTNPTHVMRSDINASGAADGLDIGPFIDLLIAQP